MATNPLRVIARRAYSQATRTNSAAETSGPHEHISNVLSGVLDKYYPTQAQGIYFSFRLVTLPLRADNGHLHQHLRDQHHSCHLIQIMCVKRSIPVVLTVLSRYILAVFPTLPT